MAGFYDEVYSVYKQKFIEMLAPVLQSIIVELTSNGGSIWDYISYLVVKGVETYVYGAYTPEKPYYKRRGSRGGLGDQENVQITISDMNINDCNISFSGEMINTTPAGLVWSDGGVPVGGGDMIEDQIISGTGYIFDLPKKGNYTGNFRKPRNFYQIYERYYNPNVSWNMVLDKLNDSMQTISEQALLDAIMELFS